MKRKYIQHPEEGMRLSFTQLSTWRRCRQRYDWWFVQKLRSSSSKGHLRGDAGHAALEKWYRGATVETALRRGYRALLVRAGREGRLQLAASIWAGLEPILRRYFAWEQSTGCPWRQQAIATEFALDYPLFAGHRIVGFIDVVLKTPDGVWLVEHKFNQNAQTAHLALDSQLTTYCLLYWLQTGVLPRGAIFNCVRVSDGPTAQQEPAKRVQCSRTKAGLEVAWRELRAEAQELLRARQRLEKGTARQAKRARAELIYRSTTHDCHWDCDLYNACRTMELTGQQPTKESFRAEDGGLEVDWEGVLTPEELQPNTTLAAQLPADVLAA